MIFRRLLIGTALLGSLVTSAHADAALLTAQKPIVVPGGAGHFDWMAVDAPRHRLYATHPGKGTLVVYDLKARTIQQLDTDGEVNGEAVDEADNRLFAAGGNQKVVAFDLKTLAKVGETALSGPADAIAFNPKNDTLYVTHDDGTEVWTVEPKGLKVTGAVAVAGAPEFLVYDAKTDRLYQNIKPANCTQVIDPAKKAVVATWPTAPMTSPHGLAIDDKTHRLFTAGQGNVDVIDMRTGKIVTTVAIAPGYVDQITFDSAFKRVYCATSPKGAPSQISVVQETADGAALRGIVTVPAGTHTLAVDPATHGVWITYSDAKDSYLQEYLPTRGAAHAR